MISFCALPRFATDRRPLQCDHRRGRRGVCELHSILWDGEGDGRPAAGRVVRRAREPSLRGRPCGLHLWFGPRYWSVIKKRIGDNEPSLCFNFGIILLWPSKQKIMFERFYFHFCKWYPSKWKWELVNKNCKNQWVKAPKLKCKLLWFALLKLLDKIVLKKTSKKLSIYCPKKLFHEKEGWSCYVKCLHLFSFSRPNFTAEEGGQSPAKSQLQTGFYINVPNFKKLLRQFSNWWTFYPKLL